MQNPKFIIHPIGHIEKTEEITSIVVDEAYTEALLNIEFFSHLIVLWWITGRDTTQDRAVLQVMPKRHPTAPLTGVFTCRSPSRPNPIGLSTVRIERYELQTNRLIIDRIDAFDGTPVIDLKPYIPSSDFIQHVKLPEWFDDLRVPKDP